MGVRAGAGGWAKPTRPLPGDARPLNAAPHGRPILPALPGNRRVADRRALARGQRVAVGLRAPAAPQGNAGIFRTPGRESG